MAIDTQRKQEDVEIDMTPMLDIVFIMLIFFIVTTVFVKQAGVEVDKPHALSSTPRTKAYVFIAIDENNEVHIDKSKVQISEIRSKLNSMRVENPEGEVVIQADKQSRSGLVLDVLDQVKRTGATVSIATDSGGD